MSYSYIDFNIDGWNAWRGKVDESLNVFRQPAVSKTPSGGAGGTNYEVENWAPLTITSGLVYIFKAHTNNGGACNIKKTGGAAINIKLIDGSNPEANAIKTGGVYYLLYDGTNLVLLNPERPTWHGVTARKSSSQSLTLSTYNGITFNIDDEDTGSFHDTSSNTSRFVAPVAGRYSLKGFFTLSWVGAGNHQAIYRIYLNGAAFDSATAGGASPVLIDNTSSTTFRRLVIETGEVSLAANDYLEIQVRPSSDGAPTCSVDASGAGNNAWAQFKRVWN